MKYAWKDIEKEAPDYDMEILLWVKKKNAHPHDHKASYFIITEFKNQVNDRYGKCFEFRCSESLKSNHHHIWWTELIAPDEENNEKINEMLKDSINEMLKDSIKECFKDL